MKQSGKGQMTSPRFAGGFRLEYALGVRLGVEMLGELSRTSLEGEDSLDDGAILIVVMPEKESLGVSCCGKHPASARSSSPGDMARVKDW